MTSRTTVVVGIVLLAIAAVAQAQTQTTKHEAAAAVSTQQITGEVLLVDGNLLLARMQPGGEYRLFNVQPGRQFMIDGQARTIDQLKPGTVLTATVSTKNQPVTVRTTTVTNGTVWYVSGNYVILTLENGENREYKVPESYTFIVEGKPATVTDLRKGMKVSGTRVVSEPQTEISSQTVITGKAPR